MNRLGDSIPKIPATRLQAVLIAADAGQIVERLVSICSQDGEKNEPSFSWPLEPVVIFIVSRLSL